MNKAQAKKVIAVIREDATGVGSLLSENGKMCVLGGLLYAAGVPKKAMLGKGLPTAPQRAILKKKYGLTDFHREVLVSTNDDYGSVDKRRRALILEVKDFIDD